MYSGALPKLRANKLFNQGLDPALSLIRRIWVTHSALVCTLPVAIGVATSVATPARAFDVPYHQEITEYALKRIRVEISGQEYTFTDKAVLEICKANVATDNLVNAALFHPEWHFTNEEFARNSKGLIDAKNRAIANLHGHFAFPQAHIARLDIGRALHTVQDFYAHSNWIELGRGGNINDDLGRRLMYNPSPYLRTCPQWRDSLSGDGLAFLTSAYYGPLSFGGLSVVPWNVKCGCGDAPFGKCFHGNEFSSSCNGECQYDGANGINKDSPSRFGFVNAYLTAADATEDYVLQIIEALQKENDERAVLALLGVEGIGFVVDRTSSMATALGGIKRTARSLANLNTSPSGSPLEILGAGAFVLVPFSGQSVGSPIATADVQEFADSVDALTATEAENYCPLVCDAISAAIEKLPPYAHVYVFTDGSQYYGQTPENIVAAARAKHIAVSFLSGSDLCDGGPSLVASSGHSDRSSVKSAVEAELQSGEFDNFTTAELYSQRIASATGGFNCALRKDANVNYLRLIVLQTPTALARTDAGESTHNINSGAAKLGRSQRILSKSATWPSPSSRFSTAMAFDASRSVTVLFGGQTSSGTLSETWEWDGVPWKKLATAEPTSRSGHAMAYEAARSVTMLFGGSTAAGLNGETWLWNGATWTQRAAVGPSARLYHAMAYDGARGVTVLFGGRTSSGGYSGETWEWNGTSWVQRATIGPSPRSGHSMAYDPIRRVTVLFGGSTPQGQSGETWEWNGTLWTQRVTTGPSPRSGHAMTYDTVRGVTVLFGGIASAGYSGETWEWNGALWTQRATTGPAARYYHAMAYDSARGVTVLFGGASTATYDDTWEWNGTSWIRRRFGKIQIPVDQVSSLQVHISTSDMTLADPSGVFVSSATPGVSVEAFGATVYTVESPSPGTWTLECPSGATVTAYVDSDIAFADVAFVTDNSAEPEGIHGGYEPIPDQPVAGETQIVKATLFGAVASAEFSLVDESGSFIAPIGLRQNYPRAVADDYMGTMLPPSQPFRLVATGTTASGHAFRREFSAPFRAVSFRVIAPWEPPSQMKDGNPAPCEFTVENRGAARTFKFTAVGARGSSIPVVPASATIPANGSQKVVAYDPTPCYARLDLGNSEIRLVATDASDSRVLNSAAVEVKVAEGLECLRSLSLGTGVLFGGNTPSGRSSETWGWSGASWIRRSLAGPSAREGHAMAYDSRRGVTVLFGGYNGTPNGETWEWNGATWTLRATSGPAPRYWHAMAYDSRRNVTVLFGGYTASGPANGTWEWDGASWSLRASTGPSARDSHAMAYDSARGVTVLFGGDTANGRDNGTWEWNGASWTLRATEGPSARYGHAMAYDAARSVAVLFGGYAGAGNGETWEWDGSKWALRATTGPSPRYFHAVEYDTSRGVTVLFGGFPSSADASQTWEWNGAFWTQQVATGPSARAEFAMSYDATPRALSAPIKLGGVHVGNTVDLDEDGAVATVTLEDYFGAITVSGNNAAIQSILDAAADGNVLREISGIVKEVNGLRQLVYVASVLPAYRSEPVQLRSVYPADFADHSPTAEGLESHIVVLDNYKFAQSGVFTINNYVNGGVVVRVSTAALAAAFNSQFGAIPTGVPLKITGVFSQNDATSPYDGGYQLLATSIKIPCPADINGDGLVEDADFAPFIAAYNILDCADPKMAAGCPADLNRDGFVDDADFSIFVVAYNELLCP